MDEQTLISKLKAGPVIPVINPASVKACLDATDALVAGGAIAIEITLRSEIAPKALEECRKAYPDIVIGAGSVMDVERYDQAEALGADFTIAPGRCFDVEKRAKGRSVVHVPGIVTPSEIIQARLDGFHLLKFYPSEAMGGAKTLKDFGHIFPDIMVMPSGGISYERLPGYASIPIVLSVGGSWMYAQNGNYREASDMSDKMRKSLYAMLKS
ncbi:2-dehydro-3-deoxyphosphogluconate aldolase / (4S)-4-hydroxy-2-oxoglutarate aldolase [Cohaesibacter marisflavi]|uniref:2-dehydro-3-deoxyphosphogluconate aldolase / (4S)-4-hydroxy-2-oxoglutarate aldolase n=1 Tax=Cohaesibacter marisflavi TaxID=655353 RepID=A0A1I5JTE0_9HYPH|nr:bifunctional 4-hydroxy-2-oxoglutarate aldolase/2-dehydro-3-deoxy-phosphogluconate aldolase [Cohaesibacter marisflavi]SFO76092.1 2-dehydro-3-deoxyphosphogluconate aldolase / (4S)-4-hydroxy-2-oxoglutarate aldolase [Cohaesibacter marisflavi]